MSDVDRVIDEVVISHIEVHQRQCPACGVGSWAYWDDNTKSGKCSNKHLIGTDSNGNLYCSAHYGGG